MDVSGTRIVKGHAVRIAGIFGRLDEALFPDADEAFVGFFKKLGYHVCQDGQLATGERWYEFYDGGLGFQISMPPPPIVELIADLPHFITGGAGVGPSNYWCACEDNEKLRDLLRRWRADEEARS